MRANVVDLSNEDGDGYFDEQIIQSTCFGSVGLGDTVTVPECPHILVPAQLGQRLEHTISRPLECPLKLL